MPEATDNQCYKNGCSESLFADCDKCGKWGCQAHMVITSKFLIDASAPFSYLCHPCLDELRKEKEKEMEHQ